MNYGAVIFLAALLGLSASWFGLVLGPQLQLGRQVQSTNTVDKVAYPVTRSGLAQEGLNVYRANGCVYCHSQQAGQTGVEFNLVLTDAGTDPVAVADALIRANVGLTNVSGPVIAAGLPKAILAGVPRGVVDAAVSALKETDAKTAVEVHPTGPDIARGWAKRRSVSADFLYDYPVMPGLLRVGPDLANVGVRLPDANWHLQHLYAPRSVVEGSAMPAYRFLFEERRIQGQRSADALSLPKEFAPAEGFEVVPTPEAKALVAYLLSLQANDPLFEAPVSVPPKAPAVTETNAPATNAAAAP